jgi:hypothetical protein
MGQLDTFFGCNQVANLRRIELHLSRAFGYSVKSSSNSHFHVMFLFLLIMYVTTTIRMEEAYIMSYHFMCFRTSTKSRSFGVTLDFGVVYRGVGRKSYHVRRAKNSNLIFFRATATDDTPAKRPSSNESDTVGILLLRTCKLGKETYIINHEILYKTWKTHQPRSITYAGVIQSFLDTSRPSPLFWWS